MQARVKLLVLPEAPKYTGNTGKPLDSDIEEAIPVEWIERKIARLKEMDNAFASLTASQITALLNDWRAEQNEE